MKSSWSLGILSSVIGSALFLTACSSGSSAPIAAPTMPQAVSSQAMLSPALSSASTPLPQPSIELEPINVAAIEAPKQPYTTQNFVDPKITDAQDMANLPLVDANLTKQVLPEEAISQIVAHSQGVANSAPLSTAPKSDFSVQIKTEDSYSTAASQAQAHCSQWSQQPGSPSQGLNAAGNTVLTYQCM